MSLSKNLEQKRGLEGSAQMLNLKTEYLQLASMVSWFSVFSRVREVSEEPAHCGTLKICSSSTRWELCTWLVESNVAVMTNPSEKKLDATMRLDTLLIPATTRTWAK
jgi:hypothetical protein